MWSQVWRPDPCAIEIAQVLLSGWGSYVLIDLHRVRGIDGQDSWSGAFEAVSWDDLDRRASDWHQDPLPITLLARIAALRVFDGNAAIALAAQEDTKARGVRVGPQARLGLPWV
jgi:hypothetical protein